MHESYLSETYKISGLDHQTLFFKLEYLYILFLKYKNLYWRSTVYNYIYIYILYENDVNRKAFSNLGSEP